MKRISKLASALVLSAALSLGVTSAAFAATVTFEGPGVGGALSIVEGTEYHETDLFENLKDVMPGDSLTQEVAVVNAHDAAVRVYLKAEAHDEEGNPLTYSEPFEAEDGKDGGADPAAGDYLGGPGERDEDAATMSDFLAQLQMRVYNGDELIFEGSPDIEGNLAEGVFLGELAAGARLALAVELSAPAGLGNEYANRVGEVDWVFSVEEADPEPGAGLDGTGDAAPLAALAAAAALAGVLALALALVRRRREGGE